MRENPWREHSPTEIEAAALTQLGGEKNKSLSTGKELRIGTNGAISVRLTGPKAGAWFNHESDTGGYLKTYSNGGADKRRANNVDKLGTEVQSASLDTEGGPELFHSSASPETGNGHDPFHSPVAKPASIEQEAEERAEREKLLHLQREFDQASLLPGSTGEGYFTRWRKLVGPFPPSLRYTSAFRSAPDATPCPAILAAVTNPEGALVGLHAIQIDPATHGKAKVEKPKLSYGLVGQGTILLGNEGEPSNTLVIAEGIETGLTRRIVGPADIHACAGGLRFVKPAKWHRRVEIIADTDKRPKARQLARRYATEYGLAAFVITVPDILGTKADLNDALQDLGMAAVQTAVEDAEHIEAQGGRAAPSPYRLERGSDVEIAEATLCILEDLYGPVVVADGTIWRYDRTHWQPIDDRQIARLIHKADGCIVHTAKGTPSFVALSKTRVVSIIDAMMSREAEPDYFGNAPVGINCESGLIAFDEHGEPELLPHARRHRQRHMVKGQWPCKASNEERASSLLAKYLREAFKGDKDAEAKRGLTTEVLGCAALGRGTRMKQPKAVIAFSTRGNTGKSTFLKLTRKLLDPSAICELPIGKLSDDRFAVQLIGKALNTSDELNDRAVRSDSFKKAVTGEPMSARDVYKPAVTFRPTALHLFSTNTLPSFKGGIDDGIVRRLLPIEFSHAVPEDQVIPDLDERIAKDEADLLLDMAVEGARRILATGLFTMPESSATLIHEWLVEADPVRGWAAERLEVTKELGHEITAAALLADFTAWAERQGFRPDHLPGPKAFGRRLMAAAPELEKKHSNGIVYQNARLRPRSTEGMS